MLKLTDESKHSQGTVLVFLKITEKQVMVTDMNIRLMQHPTWNLEAVAEVTEFV